MSCLEMGVTKIELQLPWRSSSILDEVVINCLEEGKEDKTANGKFDIIHPPTVATSMVHI